MLGFGLLGVQLLELFLNEELKDMTEGAFRKHGAPLEERNVFFVVSQYCFVCLFFFDITRFYYAYLCFTQ